MLSSCFLATASASLNRLGFDLRVPSLRDIDPSTLLYLRNVGFVMSREPRDVFRGKLLICDTVSDAGSTTLPDWSDTDSIVSTEVRRSSSSEKCRSTSRVDSYPESNRSHSDAELLASLREDVKTRFQVVLSDALDSCGLDACSDRLEIISDQISQALLIEDVDELLVEAGRLARLIAVDVDIETDECSLDGQSVAINGIVQLFETLSKTEVPSFDSRTERAISSLLTAPWAQEWAPSVSDCLATLRSEVDMRAVSLSVKEITQIDAPIPVLMYLLASGLFLGARDLALELARDVNLPVCALLTATRGLEVIDFLEPPGATQNLQGVSVALGELPDRLKVSLLETQFLTADVYVYLLEALAASKPAVMEAVVRQKKKDLTERMVEMMTLVTKACGDSEECQPAVFEALGGLIAAVELIPDSGQV